MLIRRLLVCSALATVLLTGCRHNRCQRDPGRYTAPPPGGNTIPPTAIPVGPPAIPPPPGGDRSELLLPQGTPPGRIKSDYAPPPPKNRGGAVLGEPDVAFPAPSTDGTVEPAPEKPSASDKPAAPAKPESASGIADFTQVKDGVSAGRRPELDGLDWLKAAGYKTVIFLRGRGDDDSTDRQQVEKRGMEFVGLVATPEALSRTWIDEFNLRIGEPPARPIFVYSRDESIAGAVWYLHLRTAEFFTHDEARVRAGRLGLRDETADTYRAALKVLPPGK